MEQLVEVKQLVEAIAKALVDDPEEVTVTELSGEWATILQLRVAKRDLGKVIGREGQMADSIRVIMGAIGGKLKRRYSLEILE